MLEYLKKEANLTVTENGAAAYRSTGSCCLDLFAAVGALRNANEEDILRRFVRAYAENADLAMKILFYARDVRGGLGERRVFRICLRWLAWRAPASVRKNLAYAAEYGRWDDILCVMGTPCEKDALRLIGEQLTADIAALEQGGQVSLLAKWLPSVNASNGETVCAAKRIAKYLKMKEGTYRKILVQLRKHVRILENSLREKDYTFDYAKQPSKAMLKYRKAFQRNDGERYMAFMLGVTRGENTLHTDTLMPYELVEPYLNNDHYTWGHKSFMREISEEERNALNATWEALADFAGEENALAVVDTSGSMYWSGKPLPASVALSLGLYFAERNKGVFGNCFIEFSDEPQLIELRGETFADRLQYAASFNQVAGTNLEAVFDLILRTAVKNRVPQNELPAALYIISDMEFNVCCANAEKSNFEAAREKFTAAGYALPRVVFWNVQSRNEQQPVQKNEQGVFLVSGCSPRIFGMLKGGELTPEGFMLQILSTPRYAKIAA